ncbi:MAG TPA: SagB/ThcOx family dehydrogenase, partial [Terriglobales bacterium]|nr:SagB/ThcOx family dehydrogenase [Terriglobales bacterium]
GGARHPSEVYLAALKVSGLPPGLYHYNTRSHSLECLHKGPMQEKAVQYCAGNVLVKDAAALFLMTAVFSRSMWKYRFARAYRVVLLDAGHLCQTFCLTATWLGLAPFCTAALNDSLIEKDLGLDGTVDSVLYAAAAGGPRRGISSEGSADTG